MEDAEEYHQYTNLLLKDHHFLLDLECRFSTACYFEKYVWYTW
jgi:hypothetical protein